MSKVSDFKIAESIIRKMCGPVGANFVDVSLSFDEIISGTLFIGKTKNIAHTTFKIVSEYINKSLDILGVQLMPDEEARNNFFVVLASNLRTFMYGDDASNDFVDDAHAMRLYQFPLIWILLKDIICPIYNKDIVNFKIICDGNPEIDIAKYYKKEDMASCDISEEEFIFVNIINNRVVQSAFIFIEVLKALGLSPIEVVKNIYETDLYDKYKGLLEIALEDEDVSDFECTLMTNLGVNFYSMISKKTACLNPKFVKKSQNSVPGLPNQFWQLGVLEKMIEPARGEDWSVYKSLEPYVKEFWDKVEDVRKHRIVSGHDDGVPFNVLLRLKQRQTVGYETDPTQTIQSLLSSDRVW
jgi:hypothetical protein